MEHVIGVVALVVAVIGYGYGMWRTIPGLTLTLYKDGQDAYRGKLSKAEAAETAAYRSVLWPYLLFVNHGRAYLDSVLETELALVEARREIALRDLEDRAQHRRALNEFDKRMNNTNEENE